MRGAALRLTRATDLVHLPYTPGGSWSPWTGSGWSGTGPSPPAIQLAAAQQNDGCVQLSALDPDLNLHSITQQSRGGNCNSWQP